MARNTKVAARSTSTGCTTSERVDRSMVGRDADTKSKPYYLTVTQSRKIAAKTSQSTSDRAYVICWYKRGATRAVTRCIVFGTTTIATSSCRR